VEELHKKLFSLCMQQGNTKFLGIGSGLQRKFGEVTMARNDPAGTVPEPESKRFMQAVRLVKDELDPDGTLLDLHDTGTDIEIFPRLTGGRPAFDKGAGVECLNKKLELHVEKGPNLICGDTTSDLPMVEAALKLMCPEHVVKEWMEQIDKDLKISSETDEEAPEETQDDNASEAEARDASESPEEAEARLKEEADRKAKAEEDEKQARDATAKLAVMFSITPKEHKLKPQFAARLKKICETSGAKLVIVPSPDALVASLAKYAEKVSGKKITDLALPEPRLPLTGEDGHEEDAGCWYYLPRGSPSESGSPSNGARVSNGSHPPGYPGSPQG